MLCVPRNIADIYKADMHVHINAILMQNSIRRLAAREGLDPEILAPGYIRQSWPNLPAFHKEYEAFFAKLIRTPQDQYRAMRDYLEKCASENVVYCEISASLRAPSPDKPGTETLLEEIIRAIREARLKYGIETRLIANTIRDKGGGEAMRVVRQAIRLRDDLGFHEFVGFGMSGDETCKIPLSEYIPAYRHAVENGLYCTAHAGEVSAQNLQDTLRTLGGYLRRTGHGVSALEHTDILRNEIPEIVLEICLSSNQKLGKYPDLRSHPVRALWKAGYIIVLGSDDPGPLQTSIGNEYRLAHEVCGLSLLEMASITTSAIEYSFADELTKQELFSKVNNQKQWLKMHPGPEHPLILPAFS